MDWPVLTNPIGKTIKARVANGRWVADCPRCRGAEIVHIGKPFRCLSQIETDFHGHTRPCGFVAAVEFPDNKPDIESTLMRRAEATWRNWDWGVTISEMIAAEPLLHHSWTAPRTWTTGELVTATIGNTHWRDNLLETYPAKVTTAGDIAYATAANALARLAIGAANTVLQPISGLPAYSNINIPKPIRKTADESVTTSTTLQNDDHLLFAIAANEIWSVQFFLAVVAGGPQGMKFAVTVPAGATMRFAATAGGGDIVGTTATSGAEILNSASINNIVQIMGWVANGGTAGNVQLQWAQSVGSGTSTIYANSHLLAVRFS